MGAEITWYVKVKVPMEEVVTVSAVTATEAAQETRRQYPDKDIISVEHVYHQDEVCHNCGSFLPEGCGGLFDRDGIACLRNRRDAASRPKEGK